MKYTLLQLTQTVLSSIDGDEISSITDTTESNQVVTIIKTAYFDLIHRANLPEHYSLVNLTATDASTPVQMSIPSTVDEILWLKYDSHTSDDTDLLMKPVVYKRIDEFLDNMHNLDESGTNIETFDYTDTITSGVTTFMYWNNKAPEFYTTFDDNTIIFDSYDSDVESYLHGNKTSCYARLVIPFTESDSFTPDLDEIQFSLLLNEAKSLAWAELRQAQHVKAEIAAKRGWTTLQNTKYATETIRPLDTLPNYGRK